MIYHESLQSARLKKVNTGFILVIYLAGIMKHRLSCAFQTLEIFGLFTIQKLYQGLYCLQSIEPINHLQTAFNRGCVNN